MNSQKTDSKKIRIAVQKSGRLNDGSIELLLECGIKFSTYKSSSKLLSDATNFPLEVLYLRDDDIPGYVQDGVADIGIVGENVMLETALDVEPIEKLGFSKCRISIAVPRSNTDKINKIEDLTNLRIATSYPRILTKYLRDKNVVANIHEISGSVEIAPGIGLADAICDIVDSGSTLISNGLKEIEVIMHSEAVIIAKKGLVPPKKNLSEEELKLYDPIKINILEKLLFRIRSVRKAQNHKYILLNSPNDKIDKIINILPGIKSPTIVPLGIAGWSSIHSVVEENQFWDIIESLKQAGAEGILVVPIEKIIV